MDSLPLHHLGRSGKGYITSFPLSLDRDSHHWPPPWFSSLQTQTEVCHQLSACRGPITPLLSLHNCMSQLLILSLLYIYPSYLPWRTLTKEWDPMYFSMILCVNSPQEMHTAYLNNATHTPTLKYETLLRVLWNQQDLVWRNFNVGV